LAIVYVLLFTTFAPMVDEKKLKTVKNYSVKKKCHRNWIYQLINKGELDIVKIDGVTFIKDDK
jgi:hypothetical protein